eukprot:jgi/Bigna1/84151/fgenesh1_pg.124_\
MPANAKIGSPRRKNLIVLEGKGVWAPGGLYSTYDDTYTPEMENWRFPKYLFILVRAKIHSMFALLSALRRRLQGADKSDQHGNNFQRVIFSSCHRRRRRDVVLMAIMDANATSACRESGVRFELVFTCCDSSIHVTRIEPGMIMQEERLLESPV